MNYSKKGTSKKQKSLNSKKKKVGKKMSVIFFKAFFICIIAAGVIGACAGVGVLKGVIDNAPDIDSESVIPTGYKSVVYDAEGTKVQELIASGTNRTMVTIDQIPEDVQHAFVAIEDERFYEHNGIDLIGIVRAGAKGVAAGFKFKEGASTITQQLLKNNVFNFMEEEDFTDKLERKIQEQYLAIEIEKKMSKEEILQAYLNTINLGQNTLGVEAAANRYFNKDVWDLTISEAAVIAGITKNPEGNNPVKNPEKNEERRLLVLNAMLEQKYITDAEYEEALEDDVYSRIQNVNDSVSTTTSVNSYFTDAVVKEVLEDLKELKGYSDTQAYNMLYGGGLNIYTTQNPSIQTIMDEEFSNPDNYPGTYKLGLEYAMTVVKEDGTSTNYSQEMMLKYFKEAKNNSKYELLYADEEAAQADIDEYESTIVEDGDTVYRNVELTIQPQISMVIMDQYTGQVQGIIGGRGDKTASLTLNRATDTYRQPGSTFKIVSAYAPALDAGGKSLASTQYDGPYAYESGEGKQVKNWNGEAYNGWTSLRRGIEQSMNIVAVKTYTEIGASLGLSYLEKFGFTSIITDGSQADNDWGFAVALGGLTKGVSNLELTASYASIADAGTYKEPIFYTKITDNKGNVIIDKTASQETHEAVSAETAWLLTDAMKDVVTKGTGKLANFSGMTVAGKTGTTSSNKDVWFVGYTPYYTAGIWVGYDNNHQMSSKAGETNFHKKMWSKVMARVHEELENKDFTKPDGIVSASVCAVSGKLAVAGVCDADPRGSQVRTEYFDKNNLPTESCDVHVMATICNETGLLATDHCPETHPEPRVILPVLQPGIGNSPTADTAFGVQINGQEGTCINHTDGAFIQSITVTQYYEQIINTTAAKKK